MGISKLAVSLLSTSSNNNNNKTSRSPSSSAPWLLLLQLLTPARSLVTPSVGQLIFLITTLMLAVLGPSVFLGTEPDYFCQYTTDIAVGGDCSDRKGSCEASSSC